jgi:thiosulfate/3-mercaptopyruvate sulfurtransferase
MKQEFVMRRIVAPFALVLTLVVAAPLRAHAQFAAPSSSSALSVPQTDLMQPEELVRILKGNEKEKPLVLQVGSRVMYAQVHIPGSEYAGPGSTAAGIQSLEDIVASLPKNRHIVLYCGCCPWNRCPNVGPAYKRLHDLGFTHVKVLYLANNFGDDWVGRGYPAVKGK